MVVDALFCLSPAFGAVSSLGTIFFLFGKSKGKKFSLEFFFLVKVLEMTNFQGDRGANRLATNNERELVPYFIEDTVRRFFKNVTSSSLQTYSPSNLL